MRKREIPLTEEEKRERNKIYTTRYRKSHKKKVSQMVSDYQKRIRREHKEYKERIDKALETLENIYMLDNVEITNNAVEEIDKAIKILKGETND